MSVKLKLSAVLKIVDAFTGKVVEETKIRYFGSDGRLIDKGDGVYALINWSGRSIHLFIQKSGYDSKEVTLEKQTDTILYKAITLRQKRNDTAFIECSFEKKEKRNGPVLYGFQSRGVSKRLIKDAPKGATGIKISGSVNLDEEYRNILLQDEKQIYTIMGYDTLYAEYTLDQPLQDTVEMGSMVSVLQEGVVKENFFTVEYVTNTRREEKIDKIVAVFQNTFYEAEIEEHDGKKKAIFKEW